VRCGFSPLVPLKDHVKDYYGQYIRPWIHEYLSPLPPGNGVSTGSPYVFFIARIWPESVVSQTNDYRKAFIESCRNSTCAFEGGFFTSSGETCDKEYEPLLTTQSYTTADFLSKNKASAFVFNTPAVFNCHGWKLGEFLAMGKAIISTPLSNELPEELVHGENIHFVANKEELKGAVHLLSKDEKYRGRLETEARAYFYRQIDPVAVIRNLVHYGEE
jgi:glycosyltransferase involved in cell wall biosynthesis